MKINVINENGLKKSGKVVKENFGKGRILLTIDKLSVAAAVLELGTLRQNLIHGFQVLQQQHLI